MPRPNNDANPTQEQIARRAYEIFEQRGRPEGRDQEHWLEAEAQLRAESGRNAGGNSTPSPQPAKSSRRTPARQPAGTRM